MDKINKKIHFEYDKKGNLYSYVNGKRSEKICTTYDLLKTERFASIDSTNDDEYKHIRELLKKKE